MPMVRNRRCDAPIDPVAIADESARSLIPRKCLRYLTVCRIDEAKRDDEIAYLRQSIYLREVDLFVQALSAFDRFSVRI
jgi:hypothetical protein